VNDTSKRTSSESQLLRDFIEFVGEFKNETDRSAVIVGTAKLDLLMYQLLSSYFLPCTSRNDDLLDGDSPLGTFSSRITVAHRLGLIDGLLCKALNTIRKIRNSFAHELRGATLDSGAHRDRIRELVGPLTDNETFKHFMQHFFQDQPTPRHHFMCVVAIAAARLEGAVNRCRSVANQPLALLPPNMVKAVASDVTSGDS
jgi:hypothetical protein